jgi:hypothetical protein
MLGTQAEVRGCGGNPPHPRFLPCFPDRLGRFDIAGMLPLETFLHELAAADPQWRDGRISLRLARAQSITPRLS